MIHIQLDDATRADLQALRCTAVAAAVRDRLEMLLLSDAGWAPPRIAAHLGYDAQTVRKSLHGWRQHGWAILFPAKPGPPPDTARRDRILGPLTELLGQDRTWTSAQLAEALRPYGLTLGSRQVRRYLHQPRAGYRRTASTLQHKQDPAQVGRAKTVLGNVKKSAGGSAEAVLLGRERFQPVAADRLQLVPARPTQAGSLRVPARTTGQRVGDLRPLRAGAVAGRCGVRADADQ